MPGLLFFQEQISGGVLMSRKFIEYICFASFTQKYLETFTLGYLPIMNNSSQDNESTSNRLINIHELYPGTS